MKTVFWSLGISYIAFMVTMAWASVGKETCTEPYVYSANTPLIVGLVVIFPFVLGYLSGKSDK